MNLGYELWKNDQVLILIKKYKNLKWSKTKSCLELLLKAKKKLNF